MQHPDCNEVRFKTQCTNFLNRCYFSTMFLIQIAFESSEYSEGWGFVNRISLNVKSQETKKIEVSPKGSGTS